MDVNRRRQDPDFEKENIEPGPASNADATTASDAGLTGGTGASPGEGTINPTGTDFAASRSTHDRKQNHTEVGASP